MALSSREWQRYKRQIILDPVGPEGQKRLKAARVLIVGAGGLGSPALIYLAGAGVGTLGVVDGDCVDLSNLQRQILYQTGAVGKLKSQEAAKQARALNPEVQITCHDSFLTEENVAEIVSSYDMVIDGSDNFATRYLVSDQASQSNVPYVYASIGRFSGQFSVFYPPYGPCYRCLFPHPPSPEAVPNCADAGVIGTVAGILGTMQAHEAIKLITGVGRPLLGKVMLFDALATEWKTFELPADPDCPLCGSGTRDGAPHPRATVMSGVFCQGGASEAGVVDEISPQEMRKLFKESSLTGQTPVVLDVRDEDERQQFGVIPGSRHVPLLQLERLACCPEQTPGDDEVLKQVRKDLRLWTSRENSAGLLIYCKTGPRSRRAMTLVKDFIGSDNSVTGPCGDTETKQNLQIPLRILKGGYLAWMETNDQGSTDYNI